MKNKGLHQYRFKNNPLEEKFAEAWESINNERDERHNTLGYLLSEDSLGCYVGRNEREIAATIIQWLGSPVGQFFIQDVMKDK